MHNKRLAITQEDHKRLESLLESFLKDDNQHVTSYLSAYFQKAKNESYTKTRIVFDIFHVLTQYIALDVDSKYAEFEFLRSGLYKYLNDDTIESALKSILFDKLSPAYIGAKLES